MGYFINGDKKMAVAGLCLVHDEVILRMHDKVIWIQVLSAPLSEYSAPRCHPCLSQVWKSTVRWRTATLVKTSRLRHHPSTGSDRAELLQPILALTTPLIPSIDPMMLIFAGLC